MFLVALLAGSAFVGVQSRFTNTSRPERRPYLLAASVKVRFWHKADTPVVGLFFRSWG